jgi:isoleucyl-tRNA synthetase
MFKQGRLVIMIAAMVPATTASLASINGKQRFPAAVSMQAGPQVTLARPLVSQTRPAPLPGLLFAQNELQKRSEELRAEIKAILDADEGKKVDVTERTEEILKSKSRGLKELSPEAQQSAAKAAKMEAEAQKKFRDQVKNARKDAARSLAPESFAPSAFEQEIELQKERAFRSYEREKSLDVDRDLRDFLDANR